MSRRAGDADAGRRDFIEWALGSSAALVLGSGSHSKSYGRSNVNRGGSAGKAGNGGLPPSSGSAATVRLIESAAAALLASLAPDQRRKAVFSFEDAQRLDWHYTPRPRKGLPFKELDPAQRNLGFALLGSSLGQRGLIKAATIMSLEAVLAEIEQGQGPVRDPERYFFNFMGEPGSQKPWAWRIEGHHISLNYTLVDGQLASTPCFLGANPAEVRQGPRKGLRALAGEQDLAHTLINSLDDKQRAEAVVAGAAPAEILSTNSRRAEPLKPAGIQAGRLGQKQTDLLAALLHEYAANLPADVAASRIDRIQAAGFGNIFFAWAGGLGAGQAHYYRIQSPTFLIEYDNTQNNANHIHSVWRDFDGDFGADLLALHYKNEHR